MNRTVRRIFPLVLIGIALLAGAYLWLSRPTPVLEPGGPWVIGGINVYQEGGTIPVTGYDEAAVLACLAACTQRNTLTTTDPYVQDQMTLEILLYSDQCLSGKYLVLGKNPSDTFLYLPSQQPQFRYFLTDPQSVTAELERLILGG